MPIEILVELAITGKHTATGIGFKKLSHPIFSYLIFSFGKDQSELEMFTEKSLSVLLEKS